MNIFKLEEYLTKHEFSAKYLLCCSDVESLSLSEVVDMASQDDKELWDNMSLKYTEPYGHTLLRERIASELYSGLKADNILCFAGAEEGIYCALNVLLEPTDHAIVLTPCYQSLLEVPKSRGAEVSAIQLTEENNWRIDLGAIKSAIKSNTKCIVMNFPHNPTGQVIEEEELMNLVEICSSRGIWLFSDEVYRLLGSPNKSWASPAACVYDKALSLGVMSKVFGMPGVRIGWIACQNKEILHKIKLMKDYLSISNSAPSEILSMIALSNKDEILTRNNAIVDHNIKLLDQFFIDYAYLFTWVRPQGGCVGFVKFLCEEGTDRLCDDLLKKRNVLLMPASIYDYKKNYFRIGFGRKDMPDCLNQFQEYLRDENL